MRFGTYYFLQATPDRTAAEVITEEVEQMVLSEELGFDSVWLTEHHFADYGLSAAPSVLAATVAARTQRIEIGTAVYVIPFHHPVRLAEETATLDVLSHGRLVVGIGRGNRPLEFAGHGIVQDENRSRMEEGVDVLLHAWTDERLTFHGKHWHIDNLPVHPHPLQRPHPPIAIAATSDQSVRWAAERGFRILSSGLGTSLPALERLRDVYSGALSGENRGLLDRWVVTKHVYVADTDAQAQREAEPHEKWYLNSFARSLRPDGLNVSDAVRQQATQMADRTASRRWEDLLEDALLIGSPETVRQKVAALQAAGVGELVCWMNFGGLPFDRVRRSMRLFVDEVIPAFKSTHAAVSDSRSASL
jgi:alkanesulfonate monooxygenase SsuD/methylene tetrahydromethanopterin reductase-like flavin-dependent oxidoreductase (luciferase family)